MTELSKKEMDIEVSVKSQHNPITKKGKHWLLIFLGLTLISYIVPFVFLNNVEKVYGAALFWTVWAAVFIGLMIKVMSKWRD